MLDVLYVKIMVQIFFFFQISKWFQMKIIDILNGKWKGILILTENFLDCGLRSYLLFISYKHGCFRNTLIDKAYSKDSLLNSS